MPYHHHADDRRRRAMTSFAFHQLVSLTFAALLALTLASAAKAASTQAQCHASDKGGVPAERLKHLAQGFSLPGWTDEWPPRQPNQYVLGQLRARGLTHIRLPIKLEMISTSFSPKQIVERSLEQIDRALNALLEVGFAVSLDMHPGHLFQTLHRNDPESARVELERVWRMLASRYRSTPTDRVYFELLNEPVVKADVWAKQGPMLIDAIREVAPQHTIIYGPTLYQRSEALLALSPLPQQNVVYAIHFYDPMEFTHQGQTWSADPAFGQTIPFPAGVADIAGVIQAAAEKGNQKTANELAKEFQEPWNAQRISAVFSKVSQWAERNQRPVILNEFGVLSFKAERCSRAAWVRAVRVASEQNCIGWTHWEYADGFGFVHRSGRRETIDPDLGPVLINQPEEGASAVASTCLE